jgi:plastocyanin
MRRLTSLSAFLTLGLVIAACGGGASGPGWTLGPSPATQPPASPSGSAEPSGSASPSASVAPSVAPSPSGSPAGEAVQISAAALAFEQTTVEVPADTAFTIHFDNKDAGQLHNVEIKDAAGTSLFRGDIVTGPGVADYAVPALAAGSYPFVCTVHTTMTGTITAG